MTNIVSRFDDLVAAFLEELQAENSNLTDFTTGSVIDNLAHGSAAVGFEVNNLTLAGFRKLFFATATGDDLDNLAYDRFQLLRQAAIKAVGTVNLSRATVDLGNIVIAAGTIFSTNADTDGNVYRYQTITPAVMTGLSLSVIVEAVDAGSDSNVVAGTIVNIETTLSDSSIVATNSQAMAGGTEAEDDEAFRQRVLDYLLNLRRGTVDAVEFGAKEVAGVVFATVDESHVDVDGIVDVYIADVNNEANDELITAVSDNLINWRAAGVPTSVFAVSTTTATITLDITYTAGVDQTSVQEDIINALVTFIDTLEIGDTLYLARIYQIVMDTDGVENVDIVAPVADVVPAIGERVIAEEDDILFV